MSGCAAAAGTLSCLMYCTVQMQPFERRLNNILGSIEDPDVKTSQAADDVTSQSTFAVPLYNVHFPELFIVSSAWTDTAS